MISNRKANSQRKRIKYSVRLLNQKGFAGFLVAVLLTVIFISVIANRNPAQGLIVETSAIEPFCNINSVDHGFPLNERIPEQQFHCDVIYAYVGKGNTTNSCYDLSGKAEYPLSQYPSAIYLNFTRLTNSTSNSNEAELEVYLFEITTDRNVTEKYVWIEGTNTNSSFSDFSKVQLAAIHINDLIDRRYITGQGGHFLYNWTVGKSIVGGCIGSIGCYTSNPSTQGLWSLGKPNTLSVNVRLLGWIAVNQNSAFSIANIAPVSNVLEVQLTDFNDGFIHNKTIPSNQLSEMDLFNPKIFG
jgi:hypothetical protein